MYCIGIKLTFDNVLTDIISPNPHCFETITQLKAVKSKVPVLSHHCTALWDNLWQLVSSVIDTAYHQSVVLFTQPTSGQWSQWHCGVFHKDYIAESEVSMTPPTTGQWCNWRRQPLVICHQIINKIYITELHWRVFHKVCTAESVVALIPLDSGGRCHWHRWPIVGAVNDTDDQ
jgi:hypothetical protein